jgi:hypothetical protein
MIRPTRATSRHRKLSGIPPTPGAALKLIQSAGSFMTPIQAWTDRILVAPLELVLFRAREEPSTRTPDRRAGVSPETRPESVELPGDVRSD